MYFNVNIIFINFDKHSFDIGPIYNVYAISSHTYLTPEGTRKSNSGPRPKKVVHHRFSSYLG